ncbi:MAG: hypothetical protein DWQ36_18385 [Acidobacteria bacterium]|nr:MAG: hypothetical protein DWQ36_18385 [Acidobacteriota bacterium]
MPPPYLSQTIPTSLDGSEPMSRPRRPPSKSRLDERPGTLPDGLRLDGLRLDLRYSLRSLRRRPLPYLLATLSLGLGMAATLSVLATLSSLFLQPLPGVDARLERVNLVVRDARTDSPEFASYPEYRELAELEGWRTLAGFHGTTAALGLSADADTELVPVKAVSSDYFGALGVEVARGRGFQPEEEELAAEVAVVSERFWRERFGAAAAPGGERIWINGRPLQVVGVVAGGFRGHFKGFPFDVFVPFGAAELLDLPGPSERADPERRWVELVGTLAPGAELESMAAGVQVAASRIAERRPPGAQQVEYALERSSGLDADLRGGLLVFGLGLLGIAFLLLLGGSVNAVNLTLARLAARRGELRVRAALGAPRTRIARQLCVEASLGALAALAVGLSVAWWATVRVGELFSSLDGRVHLDVGLDGRTVAAAVLLTVLVVFVSGLLPGLRAGRRFADGGFSSRAAALGGGSGQRARRTLVVVQVGLSFAILVGAALFLRALGAAAALDPGIEVDGVVAMEVDAARALVTGTEVASAGMADGGPAEGEVGGAGAESGVAEELEELEEASRRLRAGLFLDELLRRARQVPGVDGAAFVSRVPLTLGARFFANPVDVVVPGETEVQDGRGDAVEHAVVSPEYFRTLRIPLLAGRVLAPRDRADAAPVAVVSRAFLERYPALARGPVGEAGSDPASALGATLEIDGRRHEIVGVVGDVRVRRLDETPQPMLYLPLAQAQRTRMTLLARAEGAPGSGGPDAVAGALREVLREMAPSLPVSPPTPLEKLLAASLLPQRVGSSAAGALGAMGLLLAAIGLYGVLAQWVHQRRAELGLRLSLGARPVELLWMVVRQGVVLAALGIACALPLAALGSRFLGGFLYGLSPLDPLSYGAVALVLAACAALASLLPARVAAATDPMSSLRALGD